MRRNLSFVIFISIIIYALQAYALPSDKNEKVHIVSDTWTYNYKNGSSIFEGNVKVDQGTTHIRANRLITKNNRKHQIEEAIAYGVENLAHYWTLPAVGDPEIHAIARIIKFYPLTSNITLENDVTVTQGENSFKGQLIHYNMNDQTIAVPASKNGRAVVIYNPD